MFRISKSILNAAKAFLCWDAFDHLAIQLVPLRRATAYYYPPQNHLHSIVVFYREGEDDFSEPLFLLFHEVGHLLQQRRLDGFGSGEEFARMMNLDRGEEKVHFERDAWNLAEPLLDRFIKREGLAGREIKSAFAKYRNESLKSYLDVIDKNNKQ